ncbi:MAG TPA: hypothetical protein VMU36_01145 [Spirochaetia bacterium]|nr:hypothetical protein [Spirochaetia bacterium]
MKKILLPLAAILLLALAVPAFAERGEWELGLSWTPSRNSSNIADPNAVNSILGFHVGYAYSILYFSWDAFAMPDYWVWNATGYYAPGFLNLFDVGVRFVLRPVLAYGTIGFNHLYIYDSTDYGNVGVNARAGIGVKFGWWGVNFSGTQVFANWNDLSAAFSDASRGNWSTLTDGSSVSFNVAIYF